MRIAMDHAIVIFGYLFDCDCERMQIRASRWWCTDVVSTCWRSSTCCNLNEHVRNFGNNKKSQTSLSNVLKSLSPYIQDFARNSSCRNSIALMTRSLFVSLDSHESDSAILKWLGNTEWSLAPSHMMCVHHTWQCVLPDQIQSHMMPIALVCRSLTQSAHGNNNVHSCASFQQDLEADWLNDVQTPIDIQHIYCF